jgi:hypothetical protein
MQTSLRFRKDQRQKIDEFRALYSPKLPKAVAVRMLIDMALSMEPNATKGFAAGYLEGRNAALGDMQKRLNEALSSVFAEPPPEVPRSLRGVTSPAASKRGRG